jgi:hypothetical protein
MSTGGEVANALVCKTSIRGFNSRPVLQQFWLMVMARSASAEAELEATAALSLCTAPLLFE